MCTALSLSTKCHYFGRNLDIDRSYGELVVVTPRRFPLAFRKMPDISEHYAMIGVATVIDGTPLYYDATNEHELSIAGLNFPDNAYYPPYKADSDCDSITPFELIPWLLSQCKTVGDARELLSRIKLVGIPYSDALPLSPLHWMIDDKNECIVVESMRDGLHIHSNPVGVLTNNPPFEYQLFNLNNYRRLRSDTGDAHFGSEHKLDVYCQGLGALGLPGDVSSMSRFVRIAFGRANSVCEPDEHSSVAQFFRLLASVEMTRGLCRTDAGEWDITVYSSCVNTELGKYYYTTYGDSRVRCVDMHREALDGDAIACYPLVSAPEFVNVN